MELIFRKPKKEDRDKIKELLDLLTDDYIPLHSEKETLDELTDIYRGKANALIVLTQEGQVIAYTTWNQYAKDKACGYLVNLGVHPDFRQRGISTELGKRALAQIKKEGYKGVYYTTWDKNEGMIKLSKNLGMKIVDVYLDEGFRGPGGKTILFRKDF